MKTCEQSARKIYRWMRPARFNGVIVNVSWNSLRSERNIVSVITVYRLPLNFYNFYIDKTLYDSSEEMFKMSLQHCYTHKLFDISLIVCVKKKFMFEQLLSIYFVFTYDRCSLSQQWTEDVLRCLV